MTAQRPFPRRSFPRLWLRVPASEWARVKLGTKTEFRYRQRARLGGAVAIDLEPYVPCPILLYKIRRNQPEEKDVAVMVLEAAWTEPLGAISPESLEREGCETVKDFKAYWNARYPKAGGFNPTWRVRVYRVRPLQPGDFEVMGQHMIDVLYGEWL